MQLHAIFSCLLMPDGCGVAVVEFDIGGGIDDAGVIAVGSAVKNERMKVNFTRKHRFCLNM